MNELGSTYPGKRLRESFIIKKYLMGDYKIEYYNNFIVLNGHTFNGYTKAMVEAIIASLHKKATPEQGN